MLSAFKFLFVMVIFYGLTTGFGFSQNMILGSVSIDKYKVYFKEDYDNFQMYLSLKDGNIIPTCIDDDGRFKFQTTANPQSFESIWWDRPEKDSRKKLGHSEIGHIIWPIIVNISSPPPYNFFEYDRFNEIHFREKKNIIHSIRSASFEKANSAIEKIESLYDIGKIRLGKKFADEMKFALYNEICHEASRHRNKIGLSNYTDLMIENERIWLRELIIFTSDPDNPSDKSISGLIIALNDWAYFSRQAYSKKQRRWPNNSLSNLMGKDDIFRKARYKDFLLEDLLLIEEVFSKDEIVEEIKSLLAQVKLEIFNEDLRVALKGFPNSVKKEHEKIKLAELTNLFNGMNRIRRKIAKSSN